MMLHELHLYLIVAYIFVTMELLIKEMFKSKNDEVMSSELVLFNFSSLRYILVTI
jgi:hypothetical protein